MHRPFVGLLNSGEILLSYRECLNNDRSRLKACLFHEKSFNDRGEFKIYDIENGEIISEEVVATNGSGHGALSGMLKKLNVNKELF